MKDFSLYDMKIIDVYEEGQKIVVKSYLSVGFYDYVINTETKEVIRGNDKSKIVNRYILTFVKSKLGANDKTTCPNCGNIVHINASGECEYCHSVIVNKNNDFVLSEKKIAKQE